MALRRSRRNDDDATPDEAIDSPVDDADETPDEPAAPVGPPLRSFLVPTLVVVVVAVLISASLVTAFRAFRPHSLPVAVQGSEGAAEFFDEQLGSGDDPVFDIKPVPAGKTPLNVLESREFYAVLILGESSWQLQYAGANGPIVNSQLIATFQPADTKIKYSSINLVPSAQGDKSGWSTFGLVLGVVLAGLGFGLLLGLRPERLPRRTLVRVLGLFALLTGAASTLVVRYPLEGLLGNPFVPVVLQSLLAFVVAGLTYALVRTLRLYGAAIAVVLFAAFGTALSGSLLPPPYLPSFWADLVNVVPNGMASQGTIGAAYFGGASFGVGLYGLVGWTLVTIVVLALLDRFGPADKPAADDETVTA